MKRFILLCLITSFAILLSSCALIGENESFILKYCEENPDDLGCIEGSDPSGIISTEDVSSCANDQHEVDGTCVPNITTSVCNTGFHREGDSCVADTITTVVTASTASTATTTCGYGYHEEDGTCVQNDLTGECDTGFHKVGDACIEDNPIITCESGYHEEDGSCEPDLNLQCPYLWDYVGGACVQIFDFLNCDDGYHEEDGVCILNTVVCDPGNHEYDGVCVSNESVCSSDYQYYEGECWNACYLPIDHPNYAPSYTECYDDACEFHYYELTSPNSTFESLRLWIYERYAVGSFEIHYVLSNTTEIIVETGSIDKVAVDKILLRGGRATIETSHRWYFEWDEDWNLTLISVDHYVGDYPDLEIVFDNYQLFSVEDKGEW